MSTYYFLNKIKYKLNFCASKFILILFIAIYLCHCPQKINIRISQTKDKCAINCKNGGDINLTLSRPVGSSVANIADFYSEFQIVTLASFKYKHSVIKLS